MQPVDILIIDDDEDLSTVLKTLLNSAGFEVQTQSKGKRALQLLRQGNLQPRLILLDIEMPEMSGYEVCESLQADPQLALIPVIMITASLQAESRLQAFQMGAVGFMNKPVKPDLLLAQVNKALDVQKQWKSSFIPQPVSQPVSQSRKEDTPLDLFASVPQSEIKPDTKTQSLINTKAQPAAPTLPTFDSEQKTQPTVDLVPKDFFKEEPTLPVPANILTQTETKSRSGKTTFAGFCNFVKEHVPAKVAQELNPDKFYAQLEIHGMQVEQTAALVSTYTGLPFLTDIEASQLRLGVLPMPFCRKYKVVPFNNDNGELSFALTHPFQIEVQDALINYRQSPRFIAVPEVLQRLFLNAPHQKSENAATETVPQKPAAQRANEMEDLMDELQTQYTGEKPAPVKENVELEDYTSAPMIRLVNRLIEEAYHLKASDIHIEAREDNVRVRYRVDGVMRDSHQLTPASLIQPMAARIKIMAQLNIAERRLPQDGRVVYKQHNRKNLDFDLRVATSPMNYGEKIVMRILDKQKSMLPLEALGFSSYNIKRYRELLTNPYGMILHVGPTGSGKSMTLYSALNEINRPDINIQTAEDPIEYTLPNINQLQVQPDIGLTFSRALRAYLRQDPDVLLVGEIRDQETAHIAVEAALTGHLLLSTLHTNDAASTLTRFIEMGISPFMISPSVIMICAQRLIRCLCTKCKEAYTPSQLECQQLGEETSSFTLYQAKGCEHCHNTGYKGRTGIHELLIPDENIRSAITEPSVSAQSLKKMAVEQGMVTLYWDAMDKVKQGITSLEEALSKVKPDGFESRPTHF